MPASDPGEGRKDARQNDTMMDELTPQELLEQGARELGVALSDEQAAALMLVLRELQDWNRRINLTAIEDPAEIVVKHFLDSLSVAQVLDLTEGGRLIDVGTGGGFPGIPLKIAYPQLDLTLLDSVGKRLRYLDHLIELLGLTHSRTVHARAEDAARLPAHRQRYDFVTARAVAGLPTLAELCLPLATVGGVFVAMKGPEIAGEVAAARSAIAQLGGGLREIRSLSLPFGGGGRSLVVIDKRQPTPPQFPRKAGIPARQPLGG